MTPGHPPKAGGPVLEILQYGQHIFLEMFSKILPSKKHAKRPILQAKSGWKQKYTAAAK